MELRHIRFFVTLADELHFTRAAQRLHVAQPHLSQEIRRLERELGVELFSRTKRQVQLTEAGSAFRVRALELLGVLETARREARAAAEGAAGTLTIGFAGSAGYDVLPEAIRRFRTKWPAVDLVLREMHTANQLIALQEHRIDVGFVRRAVNAEKDLASRIIRREKLVVALPARHRLAKRPALALTDLEHEPWIAFDRTANSGLFADLRAACEAAGFEPILAQVAGEIPTMVNLVASGLGVALLPESVVALRRQGVVYRRLRPAPDPSLLILVWRRSDTSPVLRNFREVVAEL